MYVPKKFHEKEMLVPKIEKSADPIMIIPGVTKGKGIFIPHEKSTKGKPVGDLVIPDICLENVPQVKDVVIPDAPKKVVPKVVPQKKGMYYNPQPQQRIRSTTNLQQRRIPKGLSKQRIRSTTNLQQRRIPKRLSKQRIRSTTNLQQRRIPKGLSKQRIRSTA